MAQSLQIVILFGLFYAALGAVLPPPWANPKLNPCATQPGGWQLLYWPPDGKCYKIFKIGYPCSDDMELSPSPTKAGEQKFSAECRCPPTKAQSARDGKCYDLWTSGPCEKGSYFAPDIKYNNNSKRQWGICNQLKPCPHPNDIYWPKDSRCYPKLSKGPCPKGQLLTTDSNNIPLCTCSRRQRNLKPYLHTHDGLCYEHFTRGPCKEKGHLFLPDRTCGCFAFLPHFDSVTARCFELGSRGPCGGGEHYSLDAESRRAACHCKSGYIRYRNSSMCYRPFTRGPCEIGEMLVNSTTCLTQRCPRGYLYFFAADECHRIGERGPCKKGQIVSFDFETRPSLDGISFNGVCSCRKQLLSDKCDDEDEESCDRADGMIKYQKRCYKLYSEGPCPKGAWIAPKRQMKETIWSEKSDNEGICECLPGYAQLTKTVRNVTEIVCMPPTVILAEYLNRNFSNSAQIITL